MGRPSRKILDLREAAERLMPYYQPCDFEEFAIALAHDFGVTPEVALRQVEWTYYRLTHDGKKPYRGQPNDTTLHLGGARCEWLKAHGGKQPTVKKLVDEAMANETRRYPDAP